jgi:CheY-like chemotaxis protein
MTARVLVVDDVRSNRKLLQTRLSLEYFEVLAAANGPDALAICEKGGATSFFSTSRCLAWTVSRFADDCEPRRAPLICRLFS